MGGIHNPNVGRSYEPSEAINKPENLDVKKRSGELSSGTQTDNGSALRRQKLADFGAMSGGLPQNMTFEEPAVRGGGIEPPKSAVNTEKAPSPEGYGGVKNGEIVGSDVGDFAKGGAEADIIYGLRGNDVINGGAGDDELRGGRGADDIAGGLGDDALIGGSGFDALFGGAGDDVLNSALNGGVMVGGAGADEFYIGDSIMRHDGADTAIIADFNADSDKLTLGYKLTAQIKAHLKGEDSIVAGFEPGADIRMLEKQLNGLQGAAKGAVEFLLGQKNVENGLLADATTIRFKNGDSIVLFGQKPDDVEALLRELTGVPAEEKAQNLSQTKETAPFVRARGAEVATRIKDGELVSAIIKGDPGDYAIRQNRRGDTVLIGKPGTASEGARVVAKAGVIIAFADAPTPTWIAAGLIGGNNAALSFDAMGAAGRQSGAGSNAVQPASEKAAENGGDTNGALAADGKETVETAMKPTSDGAAKTPNEPKPMDPIAANGRVWGDPHFLGADGGRYDVQGKAGKIYNLLSDQGIQVNAKFERYGNGGATVIGEMGVTIGEDQIRIGKRGAVELNGKVISENGVHADGLITKEGQKITLSSAEYTLIVTGSGYLNIDFASANVVSDNILPHGLWGQSADEDDNARHGDKGAGAQGGGAIEALNGQIVAAGDKEAVRLYEVGGVFNTDFKNFNRFVS